MSKEKGCADNRCNSSKEENDLDHMIEIKIIQGERDFEYRIYDYYDNIFVKNKQKVFNCTSIVVIFY
jgi:hypothetical protein